LQFAEVTHSNRLEPAVGAIHHFRDQAEHHRAGHVLNNHVVKKTIVEDSIRGDIEAAAFPGSVAGDEHDDILIDLFLVRNNPHSGRVVVEKNRFYHRPEIKRESLQPGDFIGINRNRGVKAD
jgi:hypothetical protein